MLECVFQHPNIQTIGSKAWMFDYASYITTMKGIEGCNFSNNWQLFFAAEIFLQNRTVVTKKTRAPAGRDKLLASYVGL